MKKLILISALLLFGSNGWAYNKTDLAKFKVINSCEGCDLSGANLSGAFLAGANLENAKLDGRTKSYREHRRKLESARLKRQEQKKSSKFTESITNRMKDFGVRK